MFNFFQTRGFTSLHSAVHFNNLEAARLLIAKGANTTTTVDEASKKSNLIFCVATPVTIA
jgi:ankyrin repeat protein